MNGKRFVVYGNNTTKRVISDPIRMQVAMLKTRETKCLAAIIYLVVTVKEGKGKKGEIEKKRLVRIEVVTFACLSYAN